MRGGMLCSHMAVLTGLREGGSESGGGDALLAYGCSDGPPLSV